MNQYFFQIENKELINWNIGYVDSEKLQGVGKMYLTQNEITAIKNG